MTEDFLSPIAISLSPARSCSHPPSLPPSFTVSPGTDVAAVEVKLVIDDFRVVGAEVVVVLAVAQDVLGEDGLLVGQSGNTMLDNIKYERCSVMLLKFLQVKPGHSATTSFRQKSAYLTGVSSTFVWGNH